MKPKFVTKVTEFDLSLNRRVVATRSSALPTSALRKRARRYSETRSRSNITGVNCGNFWLYSLDTTVLDDSDDACDLKWRIKCPRNFRPPPWIIQQIKNKTKAKKQNRPSDCLSPFVPWLTPLKGAALLSSCVCSPK